MDSKKVQLYLDREKAIEASPVTGANCVILSDGNDLQKVLNNDLTTPTVAHEESSFKTGVGDIDVSSSVVDGEVGRMVIKGKTYQNILPEPSTHVLTNNKEMFKVNEGLDPNVEIVDGVSKSAILKGCTSYRDIDTGEILETFEEGRNLELVSVRMPVLTTTGKNLFDVESSKKGFYWSSSETQYDDTEGDSYLSEKYIPINEGDVLIANNKQGSIQYMEYDSNKNFMKRSIGVANTPYTVPSGVSFLRVSFYRTGIGSNCQLEKGTKSTPFEPYKSNILSTPSDLELRGIGDVKDTLDCLTGELTERVGEVVLNGGEDWILGTSANWNNDGDTIGFYFNFEKAKNAVSYSDKLPLNPEIPSIDSECFYINPKWSWLGVRLLKTKLTDSTVKGLKAYLRQNPITVQYQLTTESIKTVDLSSSGNWEKVVLDGSEDWAKETLESGIVRWRASLPNAIGNAPCYCDKLPVYPTSDKRDVDYVRCSTNLVWVYQKDTSLTPEQFRAKLQSNPLTVWYQVKTHQDSTQVKQPIFFKDGHIQLSSGADNSLIPTLDYEAKTSNSYVMDLMKTNTRYTMKAKSASGTFTIDGTSYGAGTNGTFTTPTSMTNKLLVMSDTAHEEVMILEGDVTDKTIPYFKGIKSTFEDESKIEVLSTGKNLTHHILGGNLESKEYNFMNIIETHKNTSGALNRAKVIKWVEKDKFFIKGYGIDQYDNQYNIDLTPTVLKPNTTYFISFESIEGSHEQQEDMKLTLGTFNVWLNNTRVIRAYEGGTYTFTTPSQVDSFNLNLWLDGTKNKNATIYAIFNKFMITEGKNIDEGYEPHKSNSTKIPLLSPLRSLPNGVCDELIIDRMKKKATLIQRVREVVLNGNENWVQSQVRDNHYVAMLSHCSEVGIPEKYPSTLLCSHFINQQPYAYDREGINVHVNYNFHIGFLKNRLSDASVNSCKKWLSQNPVIVHHELATPVVTEIDLENFPFVYKDGHIFLNSEIAPVVEIDYSINQSQQIQSNNETLQRHELDILDLDNLIVSFVDCEYRLKLLAFNIQHDILGECK